MLVGTSCISLHLYIPQPPIHIIQDDQDSDNGLRMSDLGSSVQETEAHP